MIFAKLPKSMIIEIMQVSCDLLKTNYYCMKFSIANGSQIKSVFWGILLGIIPCIVFAQNTTNSAHTRYGYGYLTDKAFISQRGMGGIGYGLRNSQMINPMNPASFSNIDSLTFMFDMGVTAQVIWFKDSNGKESIFEKEAGFIGFIICEFRKP